MEKLVYLGLGSNTGNRESELRTAVRKLQGFDLKITRVSSVYESAPMYRENQPHFLNAVVEARTRLFPMRLLLRVANIEREMGRRRVTPKGPRNIDIDILLFGGIVMNTPHLRIPHPGLAERRFVLEPLAELAPDLRHPVTKYTISELLAAVPAGGVRRTDIRLAAALDIREQ
jgi:2-amino-4-hydroxy-6-hydroxymethyldihydropteridine diphosphokinase